MSATAAITNKEPENGTLVSTLIIKKSLTGYAELVLAIGVVPFIHIIFRHSLFQSLFVGIGIFYVIKAVKRIRRDPEMVKIYADGVWLSIEKIFIPYERLYRLSLFTIYGRFTRQVAAFNFNFEVVPLPQENGAVYGWSWQRITQKFTSGKKPVSFKLQVNSEEWENDPISLFNEIAALSSEHNANKGLQPPLFAHDLPT